MRLKLFFSPLALLAFATVAHAQMTPELRASIDTAAQKVLADTGVPSASVGVVMDGKIVLTAAYGRARISPELKAAPSMAYPIGSISKQFTSTAVLLLAQEGKLSLDDKVSKFFPELTRADEITLRNLMTMTSGYEDFAPQDYIIPAFRTPEDPLATVHTWAGKPLDFTPGTQWQYSNTDYVLVALIVQKVTGEPFYQFLRERILAPLDLQGVFNAYTDREKLQVTGYTSNAMAPPRELPLEANGWYFGDGELAMPAATLLKWDLSIINRSLLSSQSYDLMETPFRLKDGRDSTYGLGIHVRTRDGRFIIEHSGEVGGFVAENVVYPNERIAVVVLTNEVASSAAPKIAEAIAPLLFQSAQPGQPPAADNFAAKLPSILSSLQTGKIDRSLLTSDGSDYFAPDTLADFKMTLSSLGTVTGVTRSYSLLRGGMSFAEYRVTFSGGTSIRVSVGLMPDGRIEQLLVTGKG
jgi:CubicO group peptidase (beta-lactamase class C family)